MGAPAWMKGFTWLSPFFDTSAQDAATPMRQENAGNDDLERGGEVRLSEDRLLPTAAPVMREVPHYRRVTTTAAAYDVQDLRDLAQRRTAERSEDVEICSNGEDSASDGEGSSFLESSRLQQSPPTTISGEQGSSSRWSRATLGQ